MNKLDQVYPEIEPRLLVYEPDALATTANLALTTESEILG